MKNKIIIFGIAIVMVLAAVAFFMATKDTAAGITSPYGIVQFELDGSERPIWVIPIEVDSSGISKDSANIINLYPSNFEEGAKGYNNYKVEEKISVAMQRKDWTCSWTLKQQCFFNFLGYCIGRTYSADSAVTPARASNVQFSIYKGTSSIPIATKPLDAFNLQDTTCLDSACKIRVRGSGLTEASFGCGQLANNVVIVTNDADSKPLIRDQDCIDEQTRTTGFLGAINPLLGLTSQFYNYFSGKSVCQYTSFYNNYISERITNGVLVAEPTFNMGNSRFTIYADADYIGKVTYTPPKQVKAEITSVSCPPALSSGSNSGAVVQVTNTESGSSGIVYVKASSSGLLSVSPLQTPTVGITDNQVFNFNIGYPVGASTDQAITLSFQACSSNELGQYCSASKTCTITAKKQGGSTTNYCGNGVCDTFETYQSCTQDCRQQTDCSHIDGSGLVGNTCKCLAGYEPTMQNGELVECNKETNYMIWIIIGAIVLVLIIIIIVSTGKKRGTF